jgi:hypothetical protein
MSKHSFTLGAVVSVSFAITAPGMAGSHSWDIVEVFSNGDGTIQFVELLECCGLPNEIGLNNKWVKSTATGKQVIFTANLPGGSTANAHLLLGTAAYAALPGAVAPDYIIVPNFFSTIAEPSPGIEYWSYDDFIFAAGELPTNGKDSLNASGVTAPNSPTNFAGESGNVDACPWDLDGDGEVGITDFLDLLGNWDNPYGINDFLDLLGSWGSC